MQNARPNPGAGYKQAGRLLFIHTVLDTDPNEKAFKGRQLNGDPLLLVKFDATEGISRMFSYDLVLLRDAGNEGGNPSGPGEDRPPLDPTRLIGTTAVIGAFSDKDKTTAPYR